MVALAVLILACGCRGEDVGPRAAAVVKTERGPGEPAAATATAVVAAATPAPKLPGRIGFVGEQGLVWMEGGTRRVVAAGVFPAGAMIGSRMVAIASRGDGSADGEQVVLLDGTRVTPLGFRAAAVRDPAVDPEGRWIVVAATRDGHSELYRLDVATGSDTRLTTNVEGNFHPATLDPKTIVFVSSRDGDAELYRMPVAGGAATRLTAFHRDDWAPTPSPDGKTIAFVSDREGRPRIFLMAADGTRVRRLTTRTESALDEIDPAWSPDGSTLAYVTERTSGGALWLHTLATGAERSPTPAGARDATPVFSPDGTWILTARGSDRAVDLWAYPRGAGAPVQVTSEPGAETVPRWLPIPPD